MAIASLHDPDAFLQSLKKREMSCSRSRNVLGPACKHRRISTVSSPELLPGLPNDLAVLCLARVPSLSLLWRVSASWQAMVSSSAYFQFVRSSLGFSQQRWIYALIHSPSGERHRHLPAPQFGLCDSAAPPAAFSWHAYDPISNSWHGLPAIPCPVEFHLSSPTVRGLVHSVQCASSATKLFMVAGSRLDRSRVNGLEPALDCPLIFDTQTRAWTQGAPYGAARKWCVCGTAANKLLVASGCGREWDMELAKAAHVYDPEGRKWVEVQRLKSSTFSRAGMSAVEYGGKLLVVSGVGVIYDPAKGEWGDMPRGMKDGWSGHAVVVGEKLYVLEECTGRLKVYDAAKDEWKCVTMADEALKHMEQLAGGASAGMFCGIVRAAPSERPSIATAGIECEGDVIRLVDLRGEKPRAVDVRPPFGRVVAVQVLERMGL